MSGEEFLNGRVRLLKGDCFELIRTLPDNSIDACITDPPYALDSIRERFGGNDAAPAKFGTDGAFARASRGFMGKAWDTGDVAFNPEFWREVWRVLKPGGHVAAFSGTRTYHRMATAIEAAGFEVRDQLAWMYGTGFPKSHNVSKAIDRHLGAEREKVRHENPRNPKATGGGRDGMEGATRPWIERAMERGYHELDSDTPATEQAAAWDGWGTSLKPAWEPICLARKPLIGNVAENVLEHGTGGINVDACRVGADEMAVTTSNGVVRSENRAMAGANYQRVQVGTKAGRFPANILHDGSDEVVGLFPESNDTGGPTTRMAFGIGGKTALGGGGKGAMVQAYGDSGSAARFYYSAKADADDRLRTKHPTVKPVDLMQWLCRLLCRKGGTVLDPFAGTGTTGQAAYWEGQHAILMEREPEYQADIAFRMNLVLSGPDERKRARTDAAPAEETPLFGWGVDDSQTQAGE